jgi:putative transposase
MVHQADKSTVDAADWNEAVAREAVIRDLVSIDQFSHSDVLRACRQLGVKRARLYQLIKAYRERPVTSSLLGRRTGPPRRVRLLPEEVEAVIEDALRDFYKSRQKPSVNRLRLEVRRLCRLRGLKAPCWQSLRARIDRLDPAEIARAREGPKVVRDQFRPVPGQYAADCAFEVVQIDHTLVDVIVVDRAFRQPLQRPWLTRTLSLQLCWSD